MAYPMKTLMVARCRRCGKRLYLHDEYYYCASLRSYFCGVCADKMFFRCPTPGAEPMERM